MRFVVMDGSENSGMLAGSDVAGKLYTICSIPGWGKQLDYLAGDQQVPTCPHPKKIVNDGKGGKLISTNDEETYTYRGTLRNKSEVLSIGYENSQKIHNALRWLMRKQGRTIGDYSMVAWESHMNNIPAWDSGTQNIVSKIDAIDDILCIVDQPLGDSVINDIVLDENPLAAEQFYQALAGYRVHLHPTSGDDCNGILCGKHLGELL
ncbi:MAG: type I-C CRISPR-associated protein Cas8c/Csd1 [Lachnospiraceae bacterium]